MSSSNGSQETSGNLNNHHINILKCPKLSSFSLTPSRLSNISSDENSTHNNKQPAVKVPTDQEISIVPVIVNDQSPDRDKVTNNLSTTTTVVPTTLSESRSQLNSAVKLDNSFVFGQNLQNRAVNFGQSNMDNLSSTREPAVACTANKTLSESAADYCSASQATKRRYEEVSITTGEEDESNSLQVCARLHHYVNSGWVERGRGCLRLNDLAENAGSRIVMRCSGSLRVILNMKLYAGMLLEHPNDRCIRLTGVDGSESQSQIKIFLITTSAADSTLLFSQLKQRLDAMSRQVSNGSGTDESSPSKHVKINN